MRALALAEEWVRSHPTNRSKTGKGTTCSRGSICRRELRVVTLLTGMLYSKSLFLNNLKEINLNIHCILLIYKYLTAKSFILKDLAFYPR